MKYDYFIDTFVLSMAKSKKPEITREKLGNNNFLINLKIEVNKVVLQGQYEKRDGFILPAEKDFEKDKFCRVYNNSERRLKMSKLSPRSKDLLMWIIYEADTGLDYIWIDRFRYMKECGVKAYNTYKDALTELWKNDYIAPTPIQSVYWINPALFFNGSRINAFPEKVVKNYRQ